MASKYYVVVRNNLVVNYFYDLERAENCVKGGETIVIFKADFPPKPGSFLAPSLVNRVY